MTKFELKQHLGDWLIPPCTQNIDLYHCNRHNSNPRLPAFCRLSFNLSRTHAVQLPPVKPQQHPLGAVRVRSVCCLVAITTSQVSRQFPWQFCASAVAFRKAATGIWTCRSTALSSDFSLRRVTISVRRLQNSKKQTRCIFGKMLSGQIMKKIRSIWCFSVLAAKMSFPSTMHGRHFTVYAL